MKRIAVILFGFLGVSVLGQRQDKVDFKHAKAAISIDAHKKQVAGEVVYTLEVLDRIDTVFLDAKNMNFSTVLLNNKKVKYASDGKTIVIHKKFKKGSSHMLSLTYTTQPKQTVYFVGWDDKKRGKEQVWTQGQGKYTSHWLPSLDDMTEKIEFDLDISFDASYKIVANGRLIGTQLKDSIKTWSYNMDRPMSSYLLAFAIGNYKKKELVSKSNVPIELYYYPDDSLSVEPTYRYTKHILDFLEEEIGVPYPWLCYKQLPVRDFLYAGMENTGTTLFSDSYVVDSTAFVDKNYVNVNAHEMAHQWFGNLVTEKDGNHHWLHEGFATYYAYLAEKEIFGEEYFYWKLFETAKTLREVSRDDNGEALTDPKASSLTFYEKGAWAVHMLRTEVGEEAFRKGIKAYLEKFKYQNATIEELIAEMELASGRSLSDFVALWLNETDFPYEKASQNLKDSCESLRKYMEMQWELSTSNLPNEEIIKRYWEDSKSEYLRKHSILQYHKSLSRDFLLKAFNTDNIKIRQALANALKGIPEGLEKEFETLLADRSYVTVENALYKLWVYAPEGRVRYLERTKDIVGLPNKNVRLLWLLLASLTTNYEDEASRQEYIEELRSYTSKEYPVEVRQNAFALLSEVLKLSDENLKDLVNASVHHSWQFRKFARELLDKTMANDKQKQRLQRLIKELKGEERRYIKSKLEVK
ncbi:MAG: M1 family metallopeptidase [Flavobacteriaceae bacterium]